jgi:hypothetical protein
MGKLGLSCLYGSALDEGATVPPNAVVGVQSDTLVTCYGHGMNE